MEILHSSSLPWNVLPGAEHNVKCLGVLLGDILKTKKIAKSVSRVDKQPCFTPFNRERIRNRALVINCGKHAFLERRDYADYPLQQTKKSSSADQIQVLG